MTTARNRNEENQTPFHKNIFIIFLQLSEKALSLLPIHDRNFLRDFPYKDNLRQGRRGVKVPNYLFQRHVGFGRVSATCRFYCSLLKMSK